MGAQHNAEPGASHKSRLVAICRGTHRSGMLDNGWVSVIRRAFLSMRVAPLAVQIIVGTVVLVIVWAAVNWVVQVVRKPTEVFVAAGGSLAKAPAQTWREYGPLFDEHSTAVITPELLAALAQVESSGNPVARTYWRR